MVLSGDYLSEVLSVCRAESSDLTGWQHSGSKTREGVQRSHHSTCRVSPHLVLSASLPGSLHSTWCFESWVHPERVRQISCRQSVLGG